MSDIFTSASAVTGNMEIRNLVQPYGTSVTRCEACPLGNRQEWQTRGIGVWIPGEFESVGLNLHRCFKGPVPFSGIGTRSTVRLGVLNVQGNLPLRGWIGRVGIYGVRNGQCEQQRPVRDRRERYAPSTVCLWNGHHCRLVHVVVRCAECGIAAGCQLCGHRQVQP